MARNNQEDIVYKSDMSMKDYKKFLKQEEAYGLSGWLVSKNYPKPRQIGYVHDLFLKVDERLQKKRQLRSDLCREIVNTLDPVPGKEEWLILYNCDQSHMGYRMIKFSYHNFFGERSLSWGFEYRNDRDVRGENLKYLTVDPRAWEYGEKFRKLEEATRSELLYSIVRKKLNDMIIEKLKDLEKNGEFNPKYQNHIVLELGGVEYVVTIDANKYPYYEIDWSSKKIKRIKLV